jgi:peptide/nickel transport system permease protein
MPETRPSEGYEWSYWAYAVRKVVERRVTLMSLVMAVVIALAAVFAPLIAPYDPFKQHWDRMLSAPTTEYLLGTDELGRDILSRIIFGARVSLGVGFVSVSISTVLGVTLGSLAGFYGGMTDAVIMRITDVLFAFPSLLFAIAIMFALGPGLINVFIALGVVGWAGIARMIRGIVLQLRQMPFVEATEAAGGSDSRIILKHILPNCLPSIIVLVTLYIPEAIMSEASLSFLGLGAQPPTPSWGSMIYDARQYIRQVATYSLFPGIAIMLTVLAFNLLGDGLRDILDPKLRT